MEKTIKENFYFIGDKVKQLFKPGLLYCRNSCVSLDVGSAYVKAISLEKSGQNINISGFGCEKIDSDVKEAIRKALSSLPVKKKEISTSVSGQSVILRYVNIPIMSHEDTAKSMSFELERYIPFNKEEVNFDFVILKKNKTTGKMLVLIAAVKKDLVNARISLCRELGYQLSFIDVCPLALANYFEFTGNTKDKVYAIVNLGAATSSIDIIEDGLLVLSRDIFIGGNDFTKKISESANKTFKEAEEIKIKSLNDSLLQSLEPVFNSLVKELKVSCDFYETQENRPVDKIMLTGGSAHLKGMLDFMKHYLGQNIELIDFNENKFKLNPSLDAEKFKEFFNFFTFSLGMALRGF